MEVFWITFRIENDVTYDDRYNALIGAVKQHNDGSWWFEPTSFWLVESNSSRAAIAASVKRAIDVGKDLVLIGSMQYAGATLVGKAKNLAELRKLTSPLAEA